MKISLARTAFKGPPGWVESIYLHNLYGYRRHLLDGLPSPFLLMYGVPPSLSPQDIIFFSLDPMDTQERYLELLTIESYSASRHHEKPRDFKNEINYKVVEDVLVARDKDFNGLKYPCSIRSGMGHVSSPRLDYPSMTWSRRMEKHPLSPFMPVAYVALFVVTLCSTMLLLICNLAPTSRLHPVQLRLPY